MAEFTFERTEEGILTGRESWVDAVTKPEKAKRERQKEVWEYIRKLEKSNERKSAVIAALQDQARKSDEKAMLLQQQVEERERERAKAEGVSTALEAEFRALADEWLNETNHLSDPVKIFMHRSHLKIIGMGEKVLPLILREVQEMTGQWFVALDAISPENPVKPEDKTNLERVADAWLKWGKERNLI